MSASTSSPHRADRARLGDDEVEEQAAERLYQRVHVLADIADEDRERLGWS